MSEGTSHCLSAYALEKALAGDGWPSPLGEAERAHLAGCPACTRRLAVARLREQEFAREVMPHGLGEPAHRFPPVSVRSRVLPRWFVPVAVAAATATAALALFMKLPEDREPRGSFPGTTSDSYVGLRGSAALVVHVQRDDARFRLEPGTVLRPGDRLRIAPVAAGRKWLLVLLRDSRGAVQVLYPWQSTGSGEMPEAGQAVPGSFALDEAPGEEVVVALASDEGLDAVAVARWLGRADWLDVGWPGEGVELAVVRYVKAAP